MFKPQPLSLNALIKIVNRLKIVLKEIMPPVQTHLHLERLTMTCPVQDLHHHPLESQQECPIGQPDLLRQ